MSNRSSWEWFAGSAGGGRGIGGMVDPSQIRGVPVEQPSKGPRTRRRAATPDQLKDLTIDSKKQEVKQAPPSPPQPSLTYVSFPNDIENLEIPYTLIKVYEIKTTADGTPDRTATDPMSTPTGVNEAAELAEVVVNSVPYGQRLATTAAGATVAGAPGALVGAFAPELAQVAADKLGVPVSDFTTKPLEALKTFGTKRNVNMLEYALALPMPENLSSQYTQNYEELSLTQSFGALGGIGQALAAKRGGLMGGGGLDPYIMEAASAILGNLPGVSGASKGIFFGTTGLAVNPQLEMIYNNPQLRAFQFDFLLTAKNSVDSAMLQNIIYQLKYYSHPKIPANTTGRYYIPPAQFEVEFYTRSRDSNVFLFKTKKCVLKDLTVDYTSAGTFASFADGSPVQVRLSLQFQEASILSRDDISTGQY